MEISENQKPTSLNESFPSKNEPKRKMKKRKLENGANSLSCKFQESLCDSSADELQYLIENASNPTEIQLLVKISKVRMFREQKRLASEMKQWKRLERFLDEYLENAKENLNIPAKTPESSEPSLSLMIDGPTISAAVEDFSSENLENDSNKASKTEIILTEKNQSAQNICESPSTPNATKSEIHSLKKKSAVSEEKNLARQKLQEERLQKKREEEEQKAKRRKLLEEERLKRRVEEEERMRKRKQLEEERIKKKQEEEERVKKRKQLEEERIKKKQEEEEEKQQRRKQMEEERVRRKAEAENERIRKLQEKEEEKKRQKRQERQLSESFRKFFHSTSKIERKEYCFRSDIVDSSKSADSAALDTTHLSAFHGVTPYFKPFEIQPDMTVSPFPEICKESFQHFDAFVEENMPQNLLSPPHYKKTHLLAWKKPRPARNPPLRLKLLAFHENIRPPYVGTWRRASLAITARAPFARDAALDYEQESEQEWEEEEEPGESVSQSEEEEESDTEDEGGDGFVVPHGYLSEDEGDVERDSPLVLADPDSVGASQRGGLSRKVAQKTFPILSGPFLGASLESPQTPPSVSLLFANLAPFLLDPASSSLPLSISNIPDSQQPWSTLASLHLSGDTPKKVVAPLPVSFMSDLVAFVHCRSLSRKKLIHKFYTLYSDSGKLFNQNQLENAILEIARRDRSNNRVIWHVKQEYLDQYPKKMDPSSTPTSNLLNQDSDSDCLASTPIKPPFPPQPDAVDPAQSTSATTTPACKKPLPASILDRFIIHPSLAAANARHDSESCAALKKPDSAARKILLDVVDPNPCISDAGTSPVCSPVKKKAKSECDLQEILPEGKV